MTIHPTSTSTDHMHLVHFKTAYHLLYLNMMNEFYYSCNCKESLERETHVRLKLCLSEYTFLPYTLFPQTTPSTHKLASKTSSPSDASSFYPSFQISLRALPQRGETYIPQSHKYSCINFNACISRGVRVRVPASITL